MIRKMMSTGVILLSFASAAVAGLPDDSSNNKYVKRGNSRLERADYDGALADFDKAIEENPTLSEVYRLRGFVHQQLKKFDLAMADYARAIELNPQSVDALLTRAKMFYQSANYTAAIEDFDRATKVDPESVTAWNWLGASHESDGDLIKAHDCYVKVTTKSAQLSNGWENLGNVYRRLGMLKEAIHAYDKSIECDANQAGLFNLRALAKEFDGNFEGAVTDLNEALRLEPANTSALMNRFMSYVYLGRNEEARHDADEYLKLVKDGRDSLVSLTKELIPIYQKTPNPKSAEDYRKRGDALSAVGYRNQAICDYRKAVQLDDFNTNAFIGLARALTLQRFFSAAIDTYLKCIEADDRFALAYEELGAVYRHNLKDADTAIRWFDKAVALGSPDGYAERGIAKMAKDDLVGAAADLSRAIEINPKMAYAYANRAECYVKMGKLAPATSDVETVLTTNPNWWYPLAVRGLIKKAKKDLAGALVDFEESIKQNRNQRNLMYRGLALLEMGKSTEAQADFDELLKMDPSCKVQLESEIAKLGSGRPMHLGAR